MPQVLCLTESTTLAAIVRRAAGSRGDTVAMLSNRHLTDATRQTIRQIAPDIIVIELNTGLDNLPLYLFLRSDDALANARIVVLWPQIELDPQVYMLEADGYLCHPLTADRVRGLLDTVRLPERQLRFQRAS